IKHLSIKINKLKDASIFELNKIYSHCEGHSSLFLGDDRKKFEMLGKLMAKYQCQIDALCLYIYVLLNPKEDYSSILSKKYIFAMSELFNKIKVNDSDYENDGCLLGSLENVLGTECYVFGLESSEIFDMTGRQGNNNLGMQSDCGVASVTQILILSGKTVTENDVVRVAVGNNLCCLGDSRMFNNGGTSAIQRKELLKLYEIESDIKQLDIIQLQYYIEHGYGVIVSVDAGILWKKKSEEGKGHAIMLYGTAHRSNDGTLFAFIACDTGSGNICLPIRVNEFLKMYYIERGANITNKPVR
ncbi:MAG: hypothetical protein LUF82_03100, partial [Clostridia bacterium]|nr:hypothetical protein [Clostridia bacterium]